MADNMQKHKDSTLQQKSPTMFILINQHATVYPDNGCMVSFLLNFCSMTSVSFTLNELPKAKLGAMPLNLPFSQRKLRFYFSVT